MGLKVVSKASSVGSPVQRKGVPEYNGRSCCQAVYQIPLLEQFNAARGIVFSATRSLDASSRARCRRRQLYHQRKSDCEKSQVTKIDTPTCHAARHKQTWEDSEHGHQPHNRIRDEDLPVKKDSTDPDPEKKKYVCKSTNQTTEPLRIEDLEEKIGSLAITSEDRPLGAVSPGDEEAYMRGEPLTPPEIEFSEHSDLEDEYWTWDQKTQRFRHWDEDLGEWVSFPERFD